MRRFALIGILLLGNVRADDEFREFKGHEGPTRVVRFTPDGTKLVSCSGWPEGDKTIRIWDVKTGKEIRVLKGHTDNIDGMCLSDDGKTILSGSADGTARLWDVESGRSVGSDPAPFMVLALPAERLDTRRGRRVVAALAGDARP